MLRQLGYEIKLYGKGGKELMHPAVKPQGSECYFRLDRLGEGYSEGGALSYTQFQRVWKYITTRTIKERTYTRYVNGQKIKHTVTPILGEKASHNGKVVYSLDFQVTPHQLRHTYITNLIYAGLDPKTVQYLAGHENSRITMDIYAKVKYNNPETLSNAVCNAFSKLALA